MKGGLVVLAAMMVGLLQNHTQRKAWQTEESLDKLVMVFIAQRWETWILVHS